MNKELELEAEKYAHNWFDMHETNNYQALKQGFKAGYNKAQETFKYTYEDLKYMFECGRNYQNNAEVTFKMSMEYLVQQKYLNYEII